MMIIEVGVRVPAGPTAYVVWHGGFTDAEEFLDVREATAGDSPPLIVFLEQRESAPSSADT